MITSLRTWLDSLGTDRIGALVLFAFVALCIVCAIYDAAHRHLARVRGPRRESHSETAHRIDGEAVRANTRPAHSGRKAGRVPTTGGTR